MLNSSHYINHGGQFTSNIVQLDGEFQIYINPQTFKCVSAITLISVQSWVKAVSLKSTTRNDVILIQAHFESK